MSKHLLYSCQGEPAVIFVLGEIANIPKYFSPMIDSKLSRKVFFCSHPWLICSNRYFPKNIIAAFPYLVNSHLNAPEKQTVKMSKFIEVVTFAGDQVHLFKTPFLLEFTFSVGIVKVH